MTADHERSFNNLDQGAFLEAIGIDPAEVERDSVGLKFEGDSVRISWVGMKYVPVSKLMFALTEAQGESDRIIAARTAAATPPKRPTRRSDAEVAYPSED